MQLEYKWETLAAQQVAPSGANVDIVAQKIQQRARGVHHSNGTTNGVAVNGMNGTVNGAVNGVNGVSEDSSESDLEK